MVTAQDDILASPDHYYTCPVESKHLETSLSALLDESCLTGASDFRSLLVISVYNIFIGMIVTARLFIGALLTSGVVEDANQCCCCRKVLCHHSISKSATIYETE